MLESEAIIEKIQLEVDNLVNALFPEDQEEVKKHLKEKNRKLKEQRNGNGKWKERKWKKFTNHPNCGYDSLRVDPPHQQFLVSSPKEVVAANDSSSLHRNVTAVRKNKWKRKTYADIIKEKISERREDKQKALAFE